MERWEQINAVQKMQDYIDHHLGEPITLSDLSRCAGILLFTVRGSDDDAPRFQLEPQGYRGYIEARPVLADPTKKCLP